MEIHIHQGGTTNTYCGQPLRLDAEVSNVSWEQAEQSNCYTCILEFFPAQSAAAREARYHGSMAWGR